MFPYVIIDLIWHNCHPQVHNHGGSYDRNLTVSQCTSYVYFYPGGNYYSHELNSQLTIASSTYMPKMAELTQSCEAELTM